MWTMLKKPGITASESHAEKWLLIISLVRRSSKTTAAAMKNGTIRWFIGSSHSPNISFTASLQAAQMVGKSGSAPTSVVYFQQRSHFSPWARSIPIDSSISRSAFQGNLRHDEQTWQLIQIFFEKRVKLFAGFEAHLGLERRADELFLSRDLQLLQHHISHCDQLVPIPQAASLAGGEARGELVGLRK